MNITAATKVFAVIGDPVGHSLSPLMHNAWFADHGLDAVYVALPLKSDDPVGAIQRLAALGFAGLNITVPHKEAAAKAAGSALAAVNVLARTEAGGLTGFNTDGDGFIDALDQAHLHWRSSVKTVVVLGAGGGAREVGRALGSSGAEGSAVEKVMFVNRTFTRAVTAALDAPSGEAGEWERLDAHFAEADLLINATTLGMSGGEAGPDWPLHMCGANTIVADIVYRPLDTKLLSAARARGLETMDGLGMLIHQGSRAFEIWFGLKPDVAKARTRLVAALAS